jgi:RNA polymerase sigma factor (sigma-70 family)
VNDLTTEEYHKQIEMMSKSMFRYCLSRTCSYHDAEDLAQEILLISCKGENSFPNEKAFYAFVWRTADNVLKSWYRNQRETEELDDTISDGSWEALEEQAHKNEQLRLITRELSLLNSNYRKAMVAYYIDEMSARDISEAFGITQSMVKYLLFQSRKKIKEGTVMERNFGRLSYDPVELQLAFWGTNNNYYGKVDKLAQNILMCCYYDKQTEEQIALQLGVSTAYLEDNLKKLLEYDLLTVKNGFYQTNVPIITNDIFAEIEKANKTAIADISKQISQTIDKMIEDVRSLGFYGSNASDNTLKWMFTSLILRLAYIDMAQGEMTLNFPIDVFGEKCFRFFVEKNTSDPYSVGISARLSGGSMILFWDVLINGRRLHPMVTDTRADMLCSLLYRQPQTDNEKLVCSELLEMGLAVKTDEGIKPNFPCLTKEQGDKINVMIAPIGSEICRSLISRTDSIREILLDHTPRHLANYVSKMPMLLYFREIEQIMQTLCESGQLLPMKGGISGTTVMYLNK